LRENLEAYLKSLYGKELSILSVRKLGETIPTAEDVKGFGYGSPLMVDYQLPGRRGSCVLSTMREQHGFGHDHFSDRARILIWQNATFSHLPKHVRSVDVGYFTPDGRLVSAGDAREYFLLMEKIEGKEYFFDLERVKEGEQRSWIMRGSSPSQITWSRSMPIRTIARRYINARSERP